MKKSEKRALMHIADAIMLDKYELAIRIASKKYGQPRRFMCNLEDIITANRLRWMKWQIEEAEQDFGKIKSAVFAAFYDYDKELHPFRKAPKEIDWNAPCYQGRYYG